ncbi:hypothetical protein Tco_1271719, partial [Tanacetum coccineum]
MTRRSRKKVQSQSFNTEEIINILKDRIGLSQERLNEVFWEAVWPRLLSNGWHSEQLTTYASKQSLVFLPPDVEKFSKRGLEKGSQYFDSLTEVLNKVTSHPHLLGNEPDQDKLVKSHAKQDVKVRELTCLQSSGPADAQASSSVTVETKQVTTEEAQNKDVNHKTANIHGVSNSPDCETSEVNNCQPVRKLKLVFKQKPKEHQVSDIRNDDSRGEDESMKDPRPEKKRRSIVLGLNNPQVGPYSLVSTKQSAKQSVSPATVCNQGELLNGASNGQRHSTRNRPLTTKALESLANGLLDPETKRKRSDDTTRKRVRAKTALMDKDMEDVDKRVEWLHCEPNFAGDIFGEPQKITRIGDEYQAQIPSLMTKNDDVKTDDQDHFDFGLSIPVTWVRSQHKKKKKKNKKERIAIEAKGKSGKIDSKRKNRLLALPCSSVEESWSVIEPDSIILGLYIFGKNLRVVNKFMGNKGMPHVISFYYGKFYRSEQHQKWSMYIKKRRTKSSPCRKTLRGLRRQELLSRLLPNVSDECKTRLTQVISAFDEGTLSFDDYVFALRDSVGIKLLVEAVAVGKEKQDLTANDKRRSRKKRLNEVFWEAVWPRLLANGWHSEQPTTYASKQSLVFLPPDVEKFSKRGLEKGSQYFDSLTEVLNKVASHPHLLGNEPDQDNSGRAADMQASSSVTVETKQVTTEEAQNKDVNHKTAEIHGVANSTDCETSE